MKQPRTTAFARFNGLVLGLAFLLGFLLVGCGQEEPSKSVAIDVKKSIKTYPATAKLPKGLQWQTQSHLPLVSNPAAKKGGTFHTSISTYPLTFRLYGPNANSGSFAILNHRLSNFSLVTRHPVTKKVIPLLATHWAVLKDQKTIYYRLDKDARWSDGTPILADDYLFAFEFYSSKHIQSPFYNQYMRDHVASIQKVDDYTIKLVSPKPSWRILHELDLSPQPRHALNANKDWVKRDNWKRNLVPGPYAITKYKRGKWVEFHRNKDWWGYSKKRFIGMFNFDVIRAQVVRTNEIEFELFKKGKLDIFTVSDGNRWNKQTDFSAIRQGYIHKQLIHLQTPAGIRGILFNTKDKLLKDRDVRLALAHVLDFKSINSKFLYNLEVRQHNFFDTDPPYKKMDQRAWPFDLTRANHLLDKAGWTAPKTAEGIRTKLGVPLAITLSTGSAAWTKFLAFYKQTALKAGIDIKIKILDGAALFKSFDQRSYQAMILVYTGGYFPSPRQFLHSENLRKSTNNAFQYGNSSLDRLIEIYERDMNEKKRIKAIFEIEQIVKNQALLVPFWRREHTRLLRWRYIKGPKSFVTPAGLDLDVLWYDANEAEQLKSFQDQGKSFKRLPVESDPFKVLTGS